MDTKNLPKSRREAKSVGAKYYFTGEPCKHGHVAPRKTKGACVECLKKEWEENKEKRAEYFAAYNKSEKGVENKKKYYTENKEVVLAKALLQTAERKRDYRNKWKLLNPDVVQANTNARRRRYRMASPIWLSKEDKKEIAKIYASARAVTKATGVQHVADHIIPLHGENVCGLHVAWNLRVITQEANLAKSNRVEE